MRWLNGRSGMRAAYRWFALGVLVAAGATPLGFRSTAAAAASVQHRALNCEYSAVCTEVQDSAQVFGDTYVGHDEPSVLFYSNKPGSGNQMRYDLTLPKDPTASSPTTPGKSYQFQLNGAFWFGMALCDTQSYPEQISTCTPDSDTNILDPAISTAHAGTAFMEMQFYPPGWVKWPVFATAIGAGSCDPTKWCAAMNIDSLGLNPVTGAANNSACLSTVGEETVNFAFITLNGVSQAPANPVQSTLTTFTPDPTKDLFMGSGDRLQVGFRDTPNGVKVTINDRTSHQTGSMTASAANGFGQVNYNPTATSCTVTPYNFHPMYSTSSEQTRVIWAAHTYNVAFSDEIGHWDYCTGTTVPTSTSGSACPSGNTEGAGTNSEPTDSDASTCFPASMSSLVQLQGCTDQNNGFDGVDYTPVWPDGNTSLHPTPIRFSSPQFGPEYSSNYNRVAFEADLPRIEGNTCNRESGVGCTLLPTDDDNQSASFYPFFSDTNSGNCVWQLGNHIPGSLNDFGQNAEYG